MSSPDVAQIVAEVLTRDGRVVLGYLFGSGAKGASGPMSDVDVAVLFSAGAPRKSAHGELMDALARALKTDRIDLVLLDEASVPLRYRIIRDGKMLLSTDKRVRALFESQAVLRYLDLEPLRNMAFRVARNASPGIG
ncbi:MAG: type VII toxin-antitoxin system MntA family adenylyltransferase antitoxin [Vicinamibacteria bacterium]